MKASPWAVWGSFQYLDRVLSSRRNLRDNDLCLLFSAVLVMNSPAERYGRLPDYTGQRTDHIKSRTDGATPLQTVKCPVHSTQYGDLTTRTKL